MMETIGPHKGFYGLLVRKVEGPSFLRMLASNFFIFSSETIRFGLSSPSAMVGGSGNCGRRWLRRHGNDSSGTMICVKDADKASGRAKNRSDSLTSTSGSRAASRTKRCSGG